MTLTHTQSRILHLLADYPVIIGLFIRLFLAWFLPWLLDNGRFIPGVAYTDIDFLVFTDAANYIKLGQSPFDRHTYRYTPFLAEILAHIPHKEAGRFLFCLADALCGLYILQHRRNLRRHQEEKSRLESSQNDAKLSFQTGAVWIRLQDALWWMYNPLAINICTRGSAESLMVLLPVLLTIRTVCGETTGWKQSLLGGFWHGVAVHSKLYPIIYTLSFMAFFAMRTKVEHSKVSQFPWTRPRELFKLIQIWFFRLFTPLPLLFFLAFAVTSFILTYLAVLWYGERALQEGLLYHFSRVDHRHNYSIYWFWIYLARARPNANMVLMGRLLVLPQIVLLVFVSLGVAPYNLPLALFIQTYLFVTHNKVITAQYFTWFLCLLPLCSDSFHLTKRVQRALMCLGLSIGLWLGSAYCLEMQGMAVHKIVWMASMGHFWANVNLMGALVHSLKNVEHEKKKSLSKTE